MGRLGYPRRFAWLTALSGCLGFGGDLVSMSNEKEMKEIFYPQETERLVVSMGNSTLKITGKLRSY